MISFCSWFLCDCHAHARLHLTACIEHIAVVPLNLNLQSTCEVVSFKSHQMPWLLGTVHRIWPLRAPVGDCHLDPSLVMATNGNHLNVAMAKHKSSSLPNYTRRTGLSLLRDMSCSGRPRSSGSSSSSTSADELAPINKDTPMKAISTIDKSAKDNRQGALLVAKSEWMLDVPRSLCQKSQQNSSLRGSLDSLSRKEKRQALKVRAEARRCQWRETKLVTSSSSDDERVFNDAKNKCRSDDALNFNANCSKEKKLRVARTERYYKRRSRDDDSLRRNGTGNSTPESEERSHNKKSKSPSFRPCPPPQVQSLTRPQEMISVPALSPRILQQPRYVLQDGVLKCILSPSNTLAEPAFVFPAPEPSSSCRQPRAPTPPPRTSNVSQTQQQVIRRGSVQGRWPPDAKQQVPQQQGPLHFTSTSTVYTISAVAKDKGPGSSSVPKPLNQWQLQPTKENGPSTTSAANTKPSSSSRSFNSVPKPWSQRTPSAEDLSRLTPSRRPTPSPEASPSALKSPDAGGNQVYIFRLKPSNDVDSNAKIGSPSKNRHTKALSLFMGPNDSFTTEALKSPVYALNSTNFGVQETSSPTTAPPPPIRKHFRQSLPVNPEAMEHVIKAIQSRPASTKNTTVNYEDALDELDKLFHSLKFSEDEQCKKSDAVNDKTADGDVKKLSPGSGPQEPDVVLDDLAYRSIRDANKSLRVKEPQPLFGIPLRPLSRSSSGDYLNENAHEAPRLTFQRRFTPDVVGDDLAYRNFRRDSIKQQQKLNFEELDAILDTSKAFFAGDTGKNRRAVRSLSANIGLSKELSVATPEPAKVGYEMDKSQSMNDLTSTSTFLKKSIGRKIERGRRNSADMSKCNDNILPPWKGSKDHNLSVKLSGLPRSGSGSSTDTLTENLPTTPSDTRILNPILRPSSLKSENDVNEVWQVRVTLGNLDSHTNPAKIKDGRINAHKDLPRPVPLRPTNASDKVGTGKATPVDDTSTSVRRNSVAPIDEDRLDAMLSNLAEGVPVNNVHHQIANSPKCVPKSSNEWDPVNKGRGFPSVVTDEATGEMSIVLPLPGLNLQETTQSRKITLTRTGGDTCRNRAAASALGSPPTCRYNERGLAPTGHGNGNCNADFQHQSNHSQQERSSATSPSFRNSVSPALHSFSSSGLITAKPPDGATERIARYKDERRKQLAATYGERISSPEDQNHRKGTRENEKVCHSAEGFIPTSPTKKMQDMPELQNGVKARSSFRRYIARESAPPETYDVADNMVRSTRASRLRAMANNTAPVAGDLFSRQGSFKSKLTSNDDVKEPQSPSSSSEVARIDAVVIESEDGLRGPTGTGCSTRPKDKSAKRKSSLNRLGAIEGTLGHNDSADEAPPRPHWRRHSGSGNGTADTAKLTEGPRTQAHLERSILSDPAPPNDSEATRRKPLATKPQIPEIFRHRSLEKTITRDPEKSTPKDPPELQQQRVRSLTEHVRELTQLARETTAQVESLTSTALNQSTGTGTMGNRWSNRGAASKPEERSAVVTDSGVDSNGASESHRAPVGPKEDDSTKVYLCNSHFELDSSQVPAVGKAFCTIATGEFSPVRVRAMTRTDDPNRRHGIVEERGSNSQSLVASVFGELKKKGIRFSDDGSLMDSETKEPEDVECSGDDSSGRSRPSILKKRSLEEVNDDHGVRSILKNKDESVRVEGRPPVAPLPHSILRKGSSEELPRARSRSPDRASILKKRNSSSEESTGRRSSSPEVVSILRRKSADETHYTSILRRRSGEDYSRIPSPPPPSFSRSANGSPETGSLHSILKRRFSSEWGDTEHPRPILKKGSAEELEFECTSTSMDPKPILKKRSSAEEDLDPRPILRSWRTSREDHGFRSPQPPQTLETGAFLRARISWGEQEPPEMEIKPILKTPPRSPNHRLCRVDSPRPRSPPMIPLSTGRLSSCSTSDDDAEFLSLPSSPASTGILVDKESSPSLPEDKKLSGSPSPPKAGARVSAMDSETSSSSASSASSSETEDDDEEGVLFSVARVPGQIQESPTTKRQEAAESAKSLKDEDAVGDSFGKARSNFIRRRAECGTERYRTQPVTSEEIDNLSGLESVTSFRKVILSKAPVDIFGRRGSAPASSPGSPKSPTDKKSKMAEFPRPFQPNARRGRSRYRTLPITLEELADAEKTEPIRTIRSKSVSLTSPKEEDEDKENDEEEEEVIHLSVAEKASLFMQKHEELRRGQRKSKGSRFADRSRRNLQRSQTQPITVEEVTEAAKIAEQSAAQRRSPGKDETTASASGSKEDADSEPEPSLLSLADRVKLFDRKMLEERLPTKKADFEPPPQGPVRRSRTFNVVSTRFRTQPVTWEEVEMAANLAKPSHCRTSCEMQSKGMCARPRGILKNTDRSVKGKGKGDDGLASPSLSKLVESKGHRTLKLSSSSSSSSSEEEETEVGSGDGVKAIAVADEDSSSASSSSATKRIKNVAVSRRRNAAIRKMEERRSLSEYHNTGSRHESTVTVSRSASLSVVQSSERSMEVVDKRKMKSLAHRSSTEPLTLEEKSDTREEVRVSIKDRLAALQKSGTEDWKKRLEKLKSDDPEKEIKSVVEPEKDVLSTLCIEKSTTQSVSSNGDRLIASRLSQLHVHSEDWKKRIEEKDATKFTVAGKMGQADKVLHPNDNLLTDRERRTPKATRFKSKSGHCLSKSPTSSPIASLAAAINSSPRGLPPISRSKTMPSPLAMAGSMGSSSDDEKNPVKVTVPRPDEGLSEFFTNVTMETLKAQKLEMCKFEEVVIDSSSMLKVHRREVVMQRRRLGARNPLRKLASRSDIQDEYTEVIHGYAEQELKRKKIEQIAKQTDLAISAIAGLASKEDFTAVSLKRSPSMSGSSLLPHKDLMLIQVKGRRHVQTRLVEPKLSSLNNGDNFILVTPTDVFHWIGKYSNVIERAKAAEVASIIQTKKDLCFGGTSDLVTLDEEKSTVNRARRRDFFEKLGGEDAISPAGDINEDELYEAVVVDTNKMFYVDGDELVPFEQYWGSLPRIEMLEPNKVLVFDFGSEMYIWHGKLALADDRKVGMQLARELWDEGFDYRDCDINPLNSIPLLQPAPSKHGEKRPPWALLAKLNQHMETVLFREKFLDWPDLERVIKVKRQDSESKSDLSPELVPCDAEDMLKNLPAEPDLILEGSHIGRGVRFWDEAEKKQYEIVTKDVKTWHVLESGPKILPLESRGQFHSGNTYVIRWHYLVTIGGRSLAGQLSKHVTGRERCAYFFWQGRDSTINEKGACALMTIELNEERGPHIRVVQGHEPPCFLNLFDGRAIVHMGKRETDFSDEDPWRLFMVQGVYENEAILVETKRSASALRSRGCLLLVNVKKGNIYLWKGSKASPHVAEVAVAAADNLQERRPQDMRFGYGARIAIHRENEGSESAEFWDGLGGGNRNMYCSLMSSETLFGYTARLFHLSSVSGTFEATEVLCPFRSKERDCPFPFLQSDLYKETQPALFMLDNENDVFLWQGWWPDAVDDSDNAATGSAKVRWNVDRRLAMDTAVAYCKAKLSEKGVLMTPYAVSAGLEPMEFINLFTEWNNHDDVAEKNMMEGKKPGEKVAVSSVLAKLKRTRYKLAELLEKPLPDGVDPMRVESYLSDDDFLEVMKMPKQEFYNLPEWKQSQVKKPTGLF